MTWLEKMTLFLDPFGNISVMLAKKEDKPIIRDYMDKLISKEKAERIS